MIDGVPILSISSEQALTTIGGTADAGNWDVGDGISNLDEAHKSLTHPAGLLEEAYEVVAVSTAGTGYSNPQGEIRIPEVLVYGGIPE